MINKESKTKAQIMKTVLKMIGDGGEHKFTTREIAKKARVNLAAINYYFGSKDDLIKEAEKYYIKKVTEITIESVERGKSIESNLLNLCTKYTEYVSANPGLQRNIWSSIIADPQTRAEVSEVIEKNVFFVKNIIKDIFKSKSDKELNFISLIFCSAIFYPVLLSQYESQVNIDIEYTHPEKLEEYYKTLVNCILSIPK
jgi:TetR/AcrR family transcriptional regulator, regulator of cefoperazone and chloramphenicol sensitivity